MEKTIIYPVILKSEQNDVFVTIPDIKGGFTQGNNEIDAIKMAQDAIGNLLEELNYQDYPTPTSPSDIKLTKGEKLVYVPINMEDFRMAHPRKIRTNVTIPEDLKIQAKKQNINISKILTNALKAELN